MLLSRFYPATRLIDIKVFWFFFSKKNCLPYCFSNAALIVMVTWSLISGTYLLTP
jgi:hypothetical protein